MLAALEALITSITDGVTALLGGWFWDIISVFLWVGLIVWLVILVKKGIASAK